VDGVLFAQLRADVLQVDPTFRRRTITDIHGPLNDGILQNGDRGEPVFELRLQLEKLDYIQNPQRNWNTDRTYDPTIGDAIRRFQSDRKINATGVADQNTRQRLNQEATAIGFAPTTEFDRAENWPPMPPPYSRPEYQVQQQARPRDPVPWPAPAEAPARRHDGAADSATPAQVDRAMPRPVQPPGRIHDGLDPSHPGHPRHALYRGCDAGVDALDRQLGRAADERSACMKASLVELAARNGFDRVDHVLLSIRSGEVQAGQNVFVVQGALGDPAHRRAHMPTGLAVATEVDDSFRRLMALDRNRSVEQAPEQDLQAQDIQARSAGARHA
jgi:peptidoglycan hydrolase-like protein with peptidoglycan-binding domain